jgi:hypothetical protein
MHELAVAKFTTTTDDEPFVPAAAFDPNADPLAAVRTRYAQRDMARRLETILLPIASSNSNNGNGQSHGSTPAGAEDALQGMTQTTDEQDCDSLLSLSDDDEPTEPHHPSC